MEQEREVLDMWTEHIGATSWTASDYAVDEAIKWEGSSELLIECLPFESSPSRQPDSVGVSSLEQPVLKEVQHVDFLGVDKFDFVYHPSIIKFVNCLELDLVLREHSEMRPFLRRTRQLLYSKYLFL